jgi:DNA polymerase-3 subunit epsilon
MTVRRVEGMGFMDLLEAERRLEASADHRVLRRVPPVEQWRLEAPVTKVRRAVFLDTETTGLDLERDEVIELALLPFEYERDTGRIVRIDRERALSALRQPSLPIPVESARIHGLSDEQVAGHVIDPEQVRAAVEDAQLVIAHNAAFDRPMVEKCWPIFEKKHWACSLVDIDWKRENLSTAKLDYLLMKQGWFHDGHRALVDALAAVFLLTLPLPVSGKRALAALLECARRPLYAVRAEETAFVQRAALKARGYRWDSGESRRTKAWWTLTSDPEREVAWLIAEIYGTPRDVPVVSVPPTMRYSGRL